MTKNTWLEDYWKDGQRGSDARTAYVPEEQAANRPVRAVSGGWLWIVAISLGLGIVAAILAAADALVRHFAP